MNQYRIRIVTSIANRLIGMMTGGGALFGVEWRLQDSCRALVLDVSGARVEHVHHLPTALLADGTMVREEGDQERARPAIAAALERWDREGTAPTAISRALPLASGAEAIATALGGDIEKLSALAYAFDEAQVERDGAVLRLGNRNHRIHATYVHGALRWEDGIATIPSKPLPHSLRMALAGRPVRALVADDAIGDRRITRVVDADPQERMIRVHTADAGKFI